MRHIAFIGLGSNLADPQVQVSHALEALNGLPQTRLLKSSSLYRSAPVGYLDQPDFINAVAQVETGLAPRALLDALLALEQDCGRTREFRNAPRTLDLDVLLYDGLVHHEHGLTIPHPQMHLRAFVLRPLLEIVPACEIPGVGIAAQALEGCADQSLERMQDVAGHAIASAEAEFFSNLRVPCGSGTGKSTWSGSAPVSIVLSCAIKRSNNLS